jgi:hypothetical protein
VAMGLIVCQLLEMQAIVLQACSVCWSGQVMPFL